MQTVMREIPQATPQATQETTSTTFENLNLIEPLLRAVKGYPRPTPIQMQAIPHLLEKRDLLGCAQTGTGKTAAFALPILQHLSENKKSSGPRGARVLVLAPTRELALQIEESFRVYGRFLRISRAVVYGGVGQGPQVKALHAGVDVLVATPGRLLDLINQGHIRLGAVETLVLDEADRMLDMGFIPDVRRIVAAIPARRQTLLFSATMPSDIRSLADSLLSNPVKVSVAQVATTAEKIEQRVLFVERESKWALLDEVLKDSDILRVLIFTRTKHGANRIAEKLARTRVKAQAIHGNKSQSARQQALENFRSGRTRVLVATDIAARGIDINGITHVINFELPNEPESYVHRIGRTARAGASGIAISFCDAGERGYLRSIEKLINRPVTVVADHPFHSAAILSGYQRASSSHHPRTNGKYGSGNRNHKPRPQNSHPQNKNKGRRIAGRAS